jgi:hypothetical protein
MPDRYRTSIAVIAGVAAGWLTNWLVMSVLPQLTQSATPGETAMPWVSQLFTHALAVSWLMPGFVAGLVAARRGILLGALAATVLSILSVGSEVVYFLTPPSASLAGAATSLLSAFTRYGASIICSAAAGGCAELLRSNKSLERTRAR